MRPWRTRLAVALVSLAVIALELALMRALAMRFWHHLAHMVISVAILGFGASGTALTLLRRRVLAHPAAWMASLTASLAMSVPACWALAEWVPLEVGFLAWDASQLLHVALLELAMLGPFALAAGVIGIALMDRPEHVSGHYAANLVGSGLVALGAVAAMHVLGSRELLMGASGAALLAMGVLVSWGRARGAVALLTALGATALLWEVTPLEPRISPYKTLSQLRLVAGAEVIHRVEGPLGRIDVVAGEAIHHAPGLSLGFQGEVPKHALMVFDGDAVSPIYDCRGPDDWAFMDHTTPAGAYRVLNRPSVLVVGAGGGAQIGLAVYHKASRVVALEANPQVVGLMTGPLLQRGGHVYGAPGVEVRATEARGYLAGNDERFDLVEMPPLDSFGASGAGLHATQESYLYTVEAFAAMLGNLSDTGVLSVTRWTRTPPRDELRVFDTAGEALRRLGRDPAQHLVMIRSWATVTAFAFDSPIDAERAMALRAFCRERSFDLCYLPGLTVGEANRFHILDEPHYFHACEALLGPERETFLADYLFRVRAATDEKPYFHHTARWRTGRILEEHLGRSGRAFVELGHWMLLAALAQATILGVVLILLPLLPRAALLRRSPRRGATLGYFLGIGAGFMLLEMAMLSRLILYLAHPIYSAATVIGGFLVFAGLGSALSTRWRATPARVATIAGVVVAILAALGAWALGPWLRQTQGATLCVRWGVALLTIAPVAMTMGHLMPTALRALGATAPAMIPWAWGANAFASVVATVATPLLAMRVGFGGASLLASACYLIAAFLARRLAPGEATPATEG
jgi:hypothetical protein